ncbi:hypothetical protein [Sorangium sp. So ce1151]|uniref:hypothetical protein n=1 Tax=Sorangium sp. So ce1151 TaxID=3133332 RepID=UPI003F63906A
MTSRTMQGLRAGLLLALVVLAAACARDGSVAISAPSVWAAAPRPPTYPLPPCEGDAFRIDLLDAVDAIPDDTLDAQREQLRDWIWTVTLGRIAQQTSVDDVFSGVVDQPVIRDDSLANVLRLPVGPTRATTTKKGTVVVLVEAADAQEMAAGVLEAIDDEALSLGRTPEQVLVYGYELKTAVAEASVCRIGQMDREKLESAAQSHRRATVTTAEELGQFLSGGVDLLSAQCTASGLELTGRQRPRNKRAEVTVEHVAALAQQLGVRYIAPSRFGVTLATVPAEMRVAIEDDADRFNAALAAGGPGRERLKREIDARPEDEQPYFRSVLAWKEENPAVPTAEIILSFFLQRMYDGRPGFSLDPVVTVAAATQRLDELIGALPDLVKTDRLLQASGDKWAIASMRKLMPGRPTLEAVRARLSELRTRIQLARDEDVLDILTAQPQGSNLDESAAYYLTWSVFSSSGQQCGRYDGPLSGTATGMTFFYTDMLAKLWVQGQKGISPEGEIEGFESVVHHAGSTAWCAQEPRPSTRLWFGVRDEAYAREPTGGVRFAPTATRIFAKGSRPGSGQGEVEPEAEQHRFIRWWDTHYGRISEWEPQYELLNQLMKWSVVTQTARIAGAPACLRFLDEVPVSTDQRFDRWIASKRDLKWRGPVRLVSAPHKATECVPLISSEPYTSCGHEATIVGGVGAATLEQVRAKPLRAAEVPVGLRRLGVDVKPETASPNSLRFDKLARSGGDLLDVEIEGAGGRLAFKARIGATESQASTHSLASPVTPVRKTEKIVESNGGALGVRQRSNDVLKVQLKTSDLARANARVRVEVTPGDAELTKSLGQQIADRMARDGVSLSEATARISRGRRAQVLDHGGVAVELRGEDGKKAYVIIESGGSPRGPPRPGDELGHVIGRPAGTPRHARSYHSRDDHLRLYLLDEEKGAPYIREHASTWLASRDATSEAVQSKLASNDPAGAMQAFEQRPTAAAAKLLLKHTLKEGTIGSAERVLKRTPIASADDLAEVQRELSKGLIEIARKGGEPSGLALMSVQLTIDGRRQLAPGTSELAALRAGAEELPVYARATYSREAGLPPALHPRGKPLSANERYVSQIVEVSHDHALPATLADAGGVELKFHAPQRTMTGKGAARIAVQTANAVGSSYRLLGWTRQRIVVVRRCSDVDESMPPCHEPDAMAEALVEHLSKELCGRNEDGTPSNPDDVACRARVRRCVQSDIGARSVDEIRACLTARPD